MLSKTSPKSQVKFPLQIHNESITDVIPDLLRNLKSKEF